MAASAWTGVRDNPPDAVLLDITVVDMDGWETARRLRMQADRAITGPAPGQAAVPIIMVSVNAFENQVVRLLEAGAQGFVDKPVIESKLWVALQRHVQLETVAELPRPGWASPARLRAVALPDDCAARLARLVALASAVPGALADACADWLKTAYSGGDAPRTVCRRHATNGRTRLTRRLGHIGVVEAMWLLSLQNAGETQALRWPRPH